MKATSQIVVELQRGDVLPLIDARGARVACLQGSLWITQENDRTDVVVQSGESFELARDGRTVVQAMEPTRAAVVQLVSAGDSSGRAQPLQMLLPRVARA